MIALFCIATCYTAIRNASSGKARWFAAAALACGIAVGLRFSVVSLGLVPLLAVTPYALRGKPDGRMDFGSLVRPFVLMTSALAAGLIIGSPSLLVNTGNALSGSGIQTLLAFTAQGFGSFQFTDGPTWRFYGAMLELAWGWSLLLAAAAGVTKVIWRVAKRELYAGDVMLMVGSGHGFRMVEDTTFLEIKQDLYTGLGEKGWTRRFCADHNSRQ